MTDAPRTIPRLVALVGIWTLVPVLRAALRLLTRGMTDVDRWERLDTAAPMREYEAGKETDFASYLAGASLVAVRDTHEVEAWLRGCEYEREPERPEAWSARPSHFERERRGNCFDHALWAWRRLRELGHDAELVMGRRDRDRQEARHAWVVVRAPGGDVLWETVEKDDEAMVRPLRDLPVDEYWPEHGIGAQGQRFVYGGYLPRLMRRFDALWLLRWRLPLGPNDEAAPRTPGTPPPRTTA